MADGQGEYPGARFNSWSCRLPGLRISRLDIPGTERHPRDRVSFLYVEKWERNLVIIPS